MEKISSSLKLILSLTKAQAMLNRKFDGQLSVHGLGFNDFVILNYLMQAPDNKMRRIDLADKAGLTASGITRMLLPLEKTGLIGRESNEHDARISYVVLTTAGRRHFKEALKTAEYLTAEVLPDSKTKKTDALTELVQEMTGRL